VKNWTSYQKISWKNAGINDNNNNNHVEIEQDSQPTLMDILEEEEDDETLDLFNKKKRIVKTKRANKLPFNIKNNNNNNNNNKDFIDKE
jgi:hypothetical protein